MAGATGYGEYALLSAQATAPTDPAVPSSPADPVKASTLTTLPAHLPIPADPLLDSMLPAEGPGRRGLELHGPPRPPPRARATLALLLTTPSPSSHPQRENIWRFFRFTRTTSRQAAMWGVLVPIGVYAIAQQQDVSLLPSSLPPSHKLTRSRARPPTQLKWQIAGAKRDDPIARWGDHAQKPSERLAATQGDADDE